uniref:Uncharacterized protein n=1 Tax=Anguilla anguilla TaxID=7936 RepID=A0A0E9QFW2_ANGAN
MLNRNYTGHNNNNNKFKTAIVFFFSTPWKFQKFSAQNKITVVYFWRS